MLVYLKMQSQAKHLNLGLNTVVHEERSASDSENESCVYLSEQKDKR